MTVQTPGTFLEKPQIVAVDGWIKTSANLIALTPDLELPHLTAKLALHRRMNKSDTQKRSLRCIYSITVVCQLAHLPTSANWNAAGENW